MIKTRRKTISKLHEFEERDFCDANPYKLPDINMSKNILPSLIEQPKTAMTQKKEKTKKVIPEET